MIDPAPACPEGTVTPKRLEIVVSGRVRNLPDGRVAAVFEGAVPALEQMRP